MRRTLVTIVSLMLLAFACASADLTYIAKNDYELRQAGTPLPGGAERLPMTVPEVVDRAAADLPWLKAWMTEDRWRRDMFEQDPRGGCEPVMSVIRLEETGQTIMLDWEERIAQVTDDAALAAWEGQASADEQEALETFDQSQADLIKLLPPELQQQFRERMAEMEQAGDAQQDAPPVVTVSVEGPLGGASVLGLSCTKYKITTETRDPAGNGPWGHTRDQSWVLLTQDLSAPGTEENHLHWRAETQAAAWEEAWERATAGIEEPEGFETVSYTHLTLPTN